MLAAIERLRLRHIDRLTPPFKGADGIRVVITRLDMMAKNAKPGKS